MKIRLLGLAVALTVQAAVAAAQDPVFSDGFESGDYAAWDAAVNGNGALSVESGSALAGTSYGLQALVNGGTSLYVEDRTPDDEVRYRARFYFDPSGFDPGPSLKRRHRTRVFAAFQENPVIRLMAILLRRVGGQYSVAARVRLNDGSHANSPFFPITPGEHWIEFEWMRATTPEAADGWVQLWIDGNPAYTLSGLANGAGAVDFVRLGALNVRTGASGVLLFDQFASRALTPIGPSLVSGEVCDLGDQCGTGSCVDGVCCNTSSCSGACRACDVALSEGSCAPIPGGQDPDGECGLVGCGGFYHSWSGDSCRRRADVSATQASCNGAEACATAAQQCPTQGVGPVVATCHDNCQYPNLSTCTGTTGPSCTNVNPGNRTCGVGACVNTVPQCINGALNTCSPLPSGTETCNDIDDNCDGTIDNGAFADGAESNGECATGVTLNGVSSDQTANYSSAFTVYPQGDFDYFRIRATETDGSCGCGVFEDPFDEDYEMRVTLTVPANSGSYEVCVGAGSCGTFANCVQVGAGQSGTARMWLDGTCAPGGPTDAYDVHVRVRGVGSPGFECTPYTLSYTFDAGYCR